MWVDFDVWGNSIMDYRLILAIKDSLKVEKPWLWICFIQTCRFSLHKSLIDGLECCGLSLSFWRHPFTSHEKKNINLHRGWSNNEYNLSICAFFFMLKLYKTSIMSSTNVQHLGLNWQSIILTISWNLDANFKFMLFITPSRYIGMSKIRCILYTQRCIASCQIQSQPFCYQPEL